MPHPNTPRLPKLTEADLNDEQLALYRQINSGPRVAGPQHFAIRDQDGALNGPFGVMLYAPAVGGPLQAMGEALRYHTRMTARTREIAILAVAAATGSEFEKYAHEQVGRAAGLTEDELSALASATFTADDATEAAAYGLCRRLLTDPSPWDDGEYEAVVAALGHEAMVELTVLVGYYRTLAQLMDVFAIGVPTELSTKEDS